MQSTDATRTCSALAVVLEHTEVCTLKFVEDELRHLRKCILFERYIATDYYMDPNWRLSCPCLGAELWYLMSVFGVAPGLQILHAACSAQGLPIPPSWATMESLPRDYSACTQRHPELFGMDLQAGMAETHDAEDTFTELTNRFSRVRHFACVHVLIVLGLMCVDEGGD